MSYRPKWGTEDTDYLVKTLAAIQDQEEMYRLLDDLCTVKEIEALAQRLQVARLLLDGETYSRIVARTGASTATISRVKRFLNFGSGGYRLVLNRLKETGE